MRFRRRFRKEVEEDVTEKYEGHEMSGGRVRFILMGGLGGSLSKLMFWL